MVICSTSTSRVPHSAVKGFRKIVMLSGKTPAHPVSRSVSGTPSYRPSRFGSSGGGSSSTKMTTLSIIWVKADGMESSASETASSNSSGVRVISSLESYSPGFVYCATTRLALSARDADDHLVELGFREGWDTNRRPRARAAKWLGARVQSSHPKYPSSPCYPAHLPGIPAARDNRNSGCEVAVGQHGPQPQMSR